MNGDDLHVDVVVIGAGPAGVAAALSAARNGSRTLLIESSPTVGGNATSGLPLLGCCNARGEWIVGGVLDDLLAGCTTLNGYVGAICDWRTLYGVCVSPDVLRLVMIEQLARHNVQLLLYTRVDAVEVAAGRAQTLIVSNKRGQRRVHAHMIVDTTGDADVAVMAGAPYEHGGEDQVCQPVSLVFRMSQIDYAAALAFVRDHPDDVLLAENPALGVTPQEAANALYEGGFPYFALAAKGKLLGGAIERGEMFPCTAIFMWPTCLATHEIGFNTTRLANVDGTDPAALSDVLATLSEQVLTAVRFLNQQVPGFADAALSGVAPQVGVRETRRIVGEHELQTEHVFEGRKCSDGVAKGGHHIDIHGAGTYQQRIPVEDGRSYDIPFGSLIPRGLANLLVAGRSLSSTRQANGSARVMGTCMAMGQAAGTAAALTAARELDDVRQLSIDTLRSTLQEQGAILEGTA